MIWSSTFRLDKDNRSRWHTCTCDQKWCWIWRGEPYNKYTRTTADWAEKKNWDSSLSRLFSLPPIHCFSFLLCLKLSLPAVFHIRSQANKRGHVNRHTHISRHTHTLTHSHTLPLHNVRSFPLLTLKDILICPFSALILMSSSYSTVTHTHTHTHWEVRGQRARHTPKFWKNTFQIG